MSGTHINSASVGDFAGVLRQGGPKMSEFGLLSAIPACDACFRCAPPVPLTRKRDIQLCDNKWRGAI